MAGGGIVEMVLPENLESDKRPRLLDVHAATQFLKDLGVSTATVNFVRNLMAQIGAIKIGKKYFISDRSILEWIARQERRRPR
jgi:hypothetical protein